MKRALLFLLLAAIPAAVHADECGRLLSLYQIRNLMMKPYTSQYDVERFTDARMEQLREGWIRWERPSSGGPHQKKEHLLNGETPDRIEESADHVYAVRVNVPRKRSLMNANNAVYVGTLEVTYEIDGKTRTKKETIDAWMNPDTSRTVDLGGIADRAHVTVDALTQKRNAKQAMVELHLRQAVATDDPANPEYETIRMLQRVREDLDPQHVDAEIAALEGSSSVPLLTIFSDLRKADELRRSKKPEEVEKGEQLLKDTLRRLR